MQQQAQGGPPQALPAGFAQMMTGIYGGMGAAGVLAGVVRIIAGTRNIRFHGRVFGIVAMVFGLLSLGTCYCSLTSVGLLIYGLIVYLNVDVIRAFELGEQGIPSDEIKARHYFDSKRPWPTQDDGRGDDWHDDAQPGPDERPDRDDPLKGDEFRPKD